MYMDDDGEFHETAESCQEFSVNGRAYASFKLSHAGFNETSLLDADDATLGDIILLSTNKYKTYNKAAVEDSPFYGVSGLAVLSTREVDCEGSGQCVPNKSPWYSFNTVFLR